MTAIDDAAILYLASQGWGDPLRCKFIAEEDLDYCDARDIVGVSADDGSPLCSKHVNDPEDNGHRLTPEVIERIREMRREHYKQAGDECPE